MTGGMYRIVIKKLTFRTIIGILPIEREIKQAVEITCYIDYPSKEEYVDYAEVIRTIKVVLQEGYFQLIEEALDALEIILIEKFPQIKRLFIRICKLEVIKDGIPCVEILREF